MPDNDLLDAKIESLDRCIDRIKVHTPISREPLRTDHDAQDIIAVNLQRAIQILVDLAGHLIAENGWETPSTMSGTFTILTEHNVLDPSLAQRLTRAVGFRNISVHEYQSIDWDRVYTIITNNLDDFRTAARSLILAWDKAQ